MWEKPNFLINFLPRSLPLFGNVPHFPNYKLYSVIHRTPISGPLSCNFCVCPSTESTLWCTPLCEIGLSRLDNGEADIHENCYYFIGYIIIIIRTSAFTSTVSPRIRMCQKTGRVGREENKNK